MHWSYQGLAALVFVLVLVATASPVKAAAISFAYLDEAALVFKPAAIPELPASIYRPGAAITFTHDIKLACKAVHTRGDDLLVFLSDTRICLTLTELIELAQEFHPEKALTAITNQDRKKLMKGLESETFLLMQPKPQAQPQSSPDGVAAALVCYCPNPPTIFEDGFESTL
jgi:hypothetical protein